MSQTSFQAEQWVPYPVELVFAFFANPYNLPLLMPNWMRVRIEEAALAPPPERPLAADPALRYKSIAAGQGSRFTISARPLPMPFLQLRIPWEAEIAEFEWNHHFCDIQLKGPFRYWRHCHSVAPQIRPNAAGEPTAGTLISDTIEYTPLFAPLSTFLVQMQLRSGFKLRHRKLDLIMPKLLASVTRSGPASNQPVD